LRSKSSLVVILTDFGSRSPFPGIMKGVMLTINPELKFVDLSNDITPYNVMEALFILKHSLYYFPDGSIFLVVVDPGVGSDRKGLIVKTKKHVFVAPDNGVLSFLFDTNPEVWEITYKPERLSKTFHGRDIFAPVVAKLSLGVDPGTLGKRYYNPVKIKIPEPEIKKDKILGRVIFIDNFGNCTTNIEQKYLHEIPRALIIKNQHIEKFVSSYSEAKEGEPIMIINSFGFLEIAINQGNASKTLGIESGDKVILLISPSSSSQTPPGQG